MWVLPLAFTVRAAGCCVTEQKKILDIIVGDCLTN